jgi:hypothetical protein
LPVAAAPQETTGWARTATFMGHAVEDEHDAAGSHSVSARNAPSFFRRHQESTVKNNCATSDMPNR